MAQPVRLTSRTLEGQFFELIQHMLALQNNSELNPDGTIYVQGQFSASNQEYTGSFNFPFEIRIDPVGNLIFSPQAKLLDKPPTIDK